MQVDKKDLDKSQVELNVELTWEEFQPYLEEGARKLAQEVKVDGFRPGNVPMDVLRRKVGDMSLLDESARIAINKTISQALQEKVEKQPVGQPQVDITKMAWDSPLGYKVVVSILPDVNLGDYKNAPVEQEKAEADEEEVEKMLGNLKDMRAQEQSVDREIRDGDKVNVDIEMFLDDVPVEGGQGKGTEVMIGQDYIVPGFDEQLKGAKKGETKEFTLPYPEDFHMKNLAGRNVDFRVKVSDVKERHVPELDDEFAATLGAQNLEDLKQNIRATLAQQKEQETKQKAEREMLEKIIGQSEFGELPEVLLNSEIDGMMDELEQNVTQQGGNFEDYLSSIGKSREQLKLDMSPEATNRVKTSLVVREVARQEGVEVPEEEVNKQIEEMRKHYEQNDQEMAKKVDTPEYRNYVANVLTSRKVIDKLRGWNITVKGQEAEQSGQFGSKEQSGQPEEEGGKEQESAEADKETEKESEQDPESEQK